jgi:hypothetical protein
MTKEEQIKKAKQIAHELRHVWPEKAAEIDKLIAEAEGGRRESLSVSVGVKYRLEKYDGDFQPGMTPFEVIEGEDKEI